MGFFGILYIITTVIYGIKTIIRDGWKIKGIRTCAGNIILFIISTVLMPIFMIFEIIDCRK